MGCCSVKQKAKLQLKQPKTQQNSDQNPRTKRATTRQLNPGNFVQISKIPLSKNYQLLSQLGDGAVGTVKLARHIHSNIQRAVKTINLTSHTNRNQVIEEVEIMRTLDHPNIVRVLQVIQQRHSYHIVMQLCSGGELFDRIIQNGSLTENQAARYISDVLSAVNYLHTNNIIHRDLKPENLLLDSIADNARIKLADFGTAVRNEPGQKQNLRIGTCYYIAPQVLLGSYDEKCDVWSIGIILFILISGTPPFNHQIESEMHKMIRRDPVQFSQDVWRTISKQAKEFVQKLLQKDPNKRPSVQEVLQDPWLKSAAQNKKPDRPIIRETLKNLQAFNGNNKICRATLGFIASQLLTKEEVQHLKDLFEAMDANKDGKLSREELQQGFQEYGMDLNIDLNQLLEKCDSDGSGFVDYTEFLAATVNWNQALSRDRLKQAFRAYDLDGNGTISIDEMKKVIGGDQTDQEFRKLIAEADSNGDGEIDLEEFVSFMTKKFGGARRLKIKNRV